MMPLTMAKPGETVTIRSVIGTDELRRRLIELGFVANAAVTVVSELGGNLILRVGETRIALDKILAQRILIGEGKTNEPNKINKRGDAHGSNQNRTGRQPELRQDNPL